MDWDRLKLRLRWPSKRTLGYCGLFALGSLPAWAANYPPLQDLPFHLAAMRVLAEFSNPAAGLSTVFQLNLLHTPYAATHTLGALLSFFLPFEWVRGILLSLYLGGTPVSLAWLAKNLGNDERVALLSVPLLCNAMFIYGFLPFVLGLPLMFWGLAETIRYSRSPSWRRGVFIAVLAVTLYYTHLLPLAIFGLGVACVMKWNQSPKKLAIAVLPFVPAVGLIVYWVTQAQFGQDSVGALGNQGAAPLNQAISVLPSWSFDVFRDTSDELVFILLVALAGVAFALSRSDPPRAKKLARGYAFLPIICGVFYFSTGEYLGATWLFAQRFPVPGLFAMVPLIPVPGGARGWLVFVLALGLAGYSSQNVSDHFESFEQNEVGGIDDAIAQMEPYKRVAGLIYDRGSMTVHHAPFLHFVSYYQAKHAGVVQFSYAHSTHWPFYYREGQFPPPGGPPILRWEWMPERVSMSELHPYYDYVLVRGRGFRPPPNKFELLWEDQRWQVYRRIDS
ncbi:MAG: hypothetical protein AAGF12_24815 [Myxococcota bacterium]